MPLRFHQQSSSPTFQKKQHPYRALPLEQRARFLETIAQRILDLGPLLIERAGQESGLPAARLEGERGRTVNQLRLFAKVVRDGHFLEATLDSALPERTPPRPDLRMRKIPLGAVAVFGASNFPLAFSVAGGDTASALAAGCPVVVKAHNAHLGTSELVGKAVLQEQIEIGSGFHLLAGFWVAAPNARYQGQLLWRGRSHAHSVRRRRSV